MALYYWDHNGKKDIIDDYLEYNIYKKVMKTDEKEQYIPPVYCSKSKGCTYAKTEYKPIDIEEERKKEKEIRKGYWKFIAIVGSIDIILLYILNLLTK